jgi:DNA polymerase III sliding clamp (beta) subunit (PCNA family)
MFKIENVKLIGRLVKREYPKYKTVIPKKTEMKITIDKLPKLAEIKGLLNPRTFGVALKNKGQNVLVLEINHNGEKFTFDVGHCCDKFEAIGINFKYLENHLKIAGSNILHLNNSLSPIISYSGDCIKTVVMPLKL